MLEEKNIFAIANGFLSRDDVFSHLINSKFIEVTAEDYNPKFSVDIDYDKYKKCICIHFTSTNQDNFFNALFYNHDINYTKYPNLSRALVELTQEEVFH
jgi:hypothetical protein